MEIICKVYLNNYLISSIHDRMDSDFSAFLERLTRFPQIVLFLRLTPLSQIVSSSSQRSISLEGYVGVVT